MAETLSLNTGTKLTNVHIFFDRLKTGIATVFTLDTQHGFDDAVAPRDLCLFRAR